MSGETIVDKLAGHHCYYLSLLLLLLLLVFMRRNNKSRSDRESDRDTLAIKDR